MSARRNVIRTERVTACGGWRDLRERNWFKISLHRRNEKKKRIIIKNKHRLLHMTVCVTQCNATVQSSVGIPSYAGRPAVCKPY